MGAGVSRRLRFDRLGGTKAVTGSAVRIGLRQAPPALRLPKEKATYAMTPHKFVVGQTATFVNEDRTRTAASGSYRIVAQRPISNGEPWYIVKSDLERYDRVVAESDLQ